MIQRKTSKVVEEGDRLMRRIRNTCLNEILGCGTGQEREKMKSEKVKVVRNLSLNHYVEVLVDLVKARPQNNGCGPVLDNHFSVCI